MRHEQVQDNLSDYIEGTLDPAMRAAVDNHIRECVDCDRDVAALRSMFKVLDSPLLHVEVPGQFHDNVMRRVRLQQRETTSRPGFLARFGWGWTAAAATGAIAGFAALVIAIGPLHQGSTASFIFTPRWSHAGADTASVTQGPDLVVGSDGMPAQAGQEYHLNLDFVARKSGTWKMSVQPSSGIPLVNPGTPDANGSFDVWEGHLSSGTRSGLTLMLQPNAPASVQELIIRFHNQETGYDVRRIVFVPVQTGGQPGALMDWQSRPNGTLRGALEDAARTYGTPVAAPVDLLDKPAPVQLRGAGAGAAMQSIAQSQGLRFNLYNDTYNVYE